MDFDKYKAVIFDMDETLLSLDVDWKRAKQAVSDYIKREYNEEINPKSFSRLFNLIAEKLGNKAFKEASQVMNELEVEGIENLRINEKTIYLLKQVKSEGKIVIVYSSNSKKAIEGALKKVGLFDQVDYIIGRDNVSHIKPDPEGLVRIMKQFNLTAEETVFIGNSLGDASAAKSQKVRFIHVNELNKL